MVFQYQSKLLIKNIKIFYLNYNFSSYFLFLFLLDSNSFFEQINVFLNKEIFLRKPHKPPGFVKPDLPTKQGFIKRFYYCI